MPERHRRRRHSFVADDDSSVPSAYEESTDEDEQSYYFARRTKAEILSGKKRRMGPQMLNMIVLDALTEGYSALVPPTMMTLCKLLRKLDMPVGAKKLNAGCVAIVVNAVSHYVSQKQWSGLLLEKMIPTTNKSTLIISKALSDAIASAVKTSDGFSFRALQNIKTGKLLEQHVANDSYYLPTLHTATPDDRSWYALSVDVVDLLQKSPQYLSTIELSPDQTPTTPAATPVTTTGNAGFFANRVLSVWGTPFHLTAHDASRTQQKYYIQFRQFIDDVQQVLDHLPSEDRDGIQSCQQHISKAVEFNKGNVQFHDGVDYAAWVEFAKKENLLKKEERGE